jgi:hypothetical protein
MKLRSSLFARTEKLVHFDATIDGDTRDALRYECRSSPAKDRRRIAEFCEFGSEHREH